MYVSEEKDGEDIEVRQRDGGWQLWLVKTGPVSDIRNVHAIGDVGYHGDD